MNIHISEDVAQGLTDILKESEASRAELVNKIRELATKKKQDGATLRPMWKFGMKVGRLIRRKQIRYAHLIASTTKQTQARQQNNVGISILEDKKTILSRRNFGFPYLWLYE